MCLRLRNEMKKRNAHHGPPIDAYIVPDTDEHQVINNLLKILYRCKVYSSSYKISYNFDNKLF